MTRLIGAGRTTFAALAAPNYRRYISGQAVSLVGTWMQMAAQSWLVLTLTGSATTLGIVIALQTLPVLLLGPYGGVIADRVDKRRLMVCLQAAMGLQALVLGVLTVTGAVELWEIGVLALLLGLNNALALAGGASIAFMSTGNSTLQLGAAPNMRGRVMSLWFVAFQGSTPIGGPIIGWVMATVGARAGLGVGAVTCLLVAALGLVAVRRGMERREHGGEPRRPATQQQAATVEA
jgi:MFS family permease